MLPLLNKLLFCFTRSASEFTIYFVLVIFGSYNQVWVKKTIKDVYVFVVIWSGGISVTVIPNDSVLKFVLLTLYYEHHLYIGGCTYLDAIIAL